MNREIIKLINLGQYLPIVFFSVAMFFFFSNHQVSNDLESYVLLSQRIQGEDLSESFSRELVEPLYLLLYWLLSNNLAPIYVFTIAGFLPLMTKIYMLRKNLTYGVFAIVF